MLGIQVDKKEKVPVPMRGERSNGKADEKQSKHVGPTKIIAGCD